MPADDLYNGISLKLVLLNFKMIIICGKKVKYKLLQSLISLVEINKNQYTCHSGGLPALRSSVAPIAARILSSSAGERDPRANAECGNWAPGNKLQWNLNWNSIIFIQENEFQNVVCQNGGHFIQGEMSS